MWSKKFFAFAFHLLQFHFCSGVRAAWPRSGHWPSGDFGRRAPFHRDATFDFYFWQSTRIGMILPLDPGSIQPDGQLRHPKPPHLFAHPDAAAARRESLKCDTQP